MHWEVTGREDDDNNLAPSTRYGHYLTELIGLLQHGGVEEDGAGGSGVVDGEIKTLLPPAAPPRHGQSTWTTTSAATSSGDQLMELPAGSAVVVGAGEAEMASWLRQVLEEGAASDRPDQPAHMYSSGSGRHIGSGLNDRGSASDSGMPADGEVAAGKRPMKEQYCCPGCCRRPPRSAGAGKRSGASRAAEQRRRDRINEKLRTLQQLVPRSNKSDKASTLDGVIQHIKYLQHQLQMMSNCGYSMAVQPYLQPGSAGVVFGYRPPPPPPTATTTATPTMLHNHVPPPAARPGSGDAHRLSPTPHHHGNAAAVTAAVVSSSPRFPPAAARNPNQEY